MLFFVLEQSMKQIKIVHKQHPTGFGKVQKHEYEGVVFEKGKVAYVDKNDQVCVYDGEEKLKEDLKKSGEVIIDEQ
jgi:hypothetical protein